MWRFGGGVITVSEHLKELKIVVEHYARIGRF